MLWPSGAILPHDIGRLRQKPEEQLGRRVLAAQWTSAYPSFGREARTEGEEYDPLMRNLQRITLALVLILLAGRAHSQYDDWTPLVALPLTANSRAFPGTDGKWHIVYELVLTNASVTPATVQRIDVVEASSPSRILASYEGSELLAHLRTTANIPAANAMIEFNGTRLFLIDIALKASAKRPKRLLHHFEVLGGAAPSRTAGTPAPLSYTVAPLDVLAGLPELGPPVLGKGWVALNGCCEVSGVHRSTGLPVNGKICFAQRFAIDWMRMDDGGHLVSGDPSDVHSYPDYGANVLAVADGKVVDTLNTLDDQKPGHLPDPKTITLENVDGNHVVLDLGGGLFAFYAHMQKGSVTVARGDEVKRGQVLGKLGNTGNTSAPHLHFHLMDGPSVLGSSGLPYVIDSFVYAGQVPAAEFAQATDVEGDWSKGLLTTPSPRRGQFPLDLAVVTFSAAKPAAKGAKPSGSGALKTP